MTIQANQGFGVSVFGATGSGGGGTTSPGGSSLQIQYNAAGSFGGMAGTSWDNTNRSLTLTGATVTTSNPVLNLSQTWNAGAVTFKGWVLNVTDTASASASLLMDLQVGGTSKFSVDKTGNAIGVSFRQTSSGAGIVTNANGSRLSLYSNNAEVAYLSGNEFDFSSSAVLQWSSSAASSGSYDLILGRNAAASLRLGAADAAAPVAQTLGVQSVVAGTSNTAGVNFTIKGSAGTGTGAGGSIIFQVSPAGSTGTAQNAFATALTISSDKFATFAGRTTINGDFLIIPSHATPASSGLAFAGGIYVGSGAVDTLSLQYNGNSNIVRLAIDANNTLALRNGTSAQTFNVYGTYTDSSNYERLRLTFPASGPATIISEAAGTGTARPLTLQATGSSYIQFNTGAADRWYINSSGHFLANTDNTYDIGASGANRPRNVYVANSLTVTGTGSFRGVTVGQPSEYLAWSGSSKINAATDGLLALYNAAASDFGRLQFGGTTSSFPALKRSSAALQARLADDSGYTDIGLRAVIANGVTYANLPGTPAAGTIAHVTDASNAGAAWGDSVTAGGSTNKYLVWYNGTNWTVMGK